MTPFTHTLGLNIALFLTKVALDVCFHLILLEEWHPVGEHGKFCSVLQLPAQEGICGWSV